MTNLYGTYKAFMQRASRATSLKNAMLANSLVAQMESILGKPTVDKAKKLQKLEEAFFEARQIPLSNNWFSPTVLEAIKSKNYVIERPTVNVNRVSGYAPADGYIYVAESVGISDHIKVGFTLLEPEQRISKYQAKYRDNVLLNGFAHVDSPVQIGKEISFRLKKYSAGAELKHKSNEIYLCSAEKAVATIFESARDLRLRIYKSTWDNPNDIKKPVALSRFDNLVREILDFECTYFIPAEKLEAVESHLMDMLETITELEKQVIVVQFGLMKKGQRLSVEQTAKNLKVHSRWARNLSFSGLAKLAGPNRAQRLRKMLVE